MTNEEKKLNEAIKQDGIETQSEILEELKRRFPQYVEQSHNEQEIERLKSVLNAMCAHIDGECDCSCTDCIAAGLVAVGIGDKKQAVKEFANKELIFISRIRKENGTKRECDKLVGEAELKELIDNILSKIQRHIFNAYKELYGAEE